MTDEDLRRVAIHEAGHAWAAFRCGRASGPVTVTATRQWAGMACFGGPLVGAADWGRLDSSKPLPCWPGRVRRRFDTAAMIAAAGDEAAEALWWRAGPGRTGRRADPVTEQAGDLAAAPGRAEELRLAAAMADTAALTDAQVLAGIAAALYPDDALTRMAWLNYVRAETRAMVAGGAPAVLRLAGVLAERGSLSGRAVRAILAGVQA